MKVALGLKSHSGWAALVVVGAAGDGFEIIDRRRIELIEDGELWAKQPYHSAEDLEASEAAVVVERGIRSARRVAVTRLKESIARLKKLKYDIAACSVLISAPMPDWSTADILAVHMRMHKAEGVLFPEALCRAVTSCKLPLVAVPEKLLTERAGGRAFAYVWPDRKADRRHRQSHWCTLGQRPKKRSACRNDSFGR